MRLFDLARGPGETRDLAQALPETVAALERALVGWEAQLIAPRWRTADVWRREQVEIHSAD
ncbi:MAG: hypothetical protein O2816_08930 [Planctomycetota bacterium]|nr:hypothetical protein [Planctomycetota bacterium]